MLQNYGSKYVLSKDEKQSVREALQKSSFAQYYSEKLQQALTYENWKESGKFFLHFEQFKTRI